MSTSRTRWVCAKAPAGGYDECHLEWVPKSIKGFMTGTGAAGGKTKATLVDDDFDDAEKGVASGTDKMHNFDGPTSAAFDDYPDVPTASMQADWEQSCADEMRAGSGWFSRGISKSDLAPARCPSATRSRDTILQNYRGMWDTWIAQYADKGRAWTEKEKERFAQAQAQFKDAMEKRDADLRRKDVERVVRGTSWEDFDLAPETKQGMIQLREYRRGRGALGTRKAATAPRRVRRSAPPARARSSRR